MQNLDPSYLRYIYDSLEKGSIHPESASELPDGLIGLYEETFDHLPVKKRQYLFRILALFALLKKEVSINFIAKVLEESEDEIADFILKYSSWFNSPESGKLQLYHERLKVYLLQKLSEREIQSMILSLIDCLSNDNNSEEIKNFSNEWLGFYFLSVGKIDSGLEFLINNCALQKENWWENTFDLYCSCIFTDTNYVISETEINFYSHINSRQLCTVAAKLVVRNFERIAWDDFIIDSTSETRFHYVLAGILNKRIDSLPKELICHMILDENHYLSYVMAYAWKYNCWVREDVLFPELIEKIKNNGSPYLRILLRQIDGGRVMLNKKPILNKIDYEKDCWEYVTEDFIEYVNIGKEQLFKQHFDDVAFCSGLENAKLEFILYEFDSLHIQIERLQNAKNTINKSQFFFQIIEILWLHPAWEIGEIGNDLVRYKLNTTKEQTSIEECTNWIYRLAKEKSTYSISILIFDIIEVVEVTNQYVKDLVECILGWQNAQIRGQFIASANNFFLSNNDKRWFELLREKFFKLCYLASDIWETQEIIELFKTLKDRLTTDEINHYLKHHRLLSKIPEAFEVDWIVFWKTAEKMRLEGEI